MKIVERIQCTLSERVKIQDSVIRISCSIGIGVYVFDESLETSNILNDADSAMYKVESNEGSYSFYNYWLLNLGKLFLMRTEGKC